MNGIDTPQPAFEPTGRQRNQPTQDNPKVSEDIGAMQAGKRKIDRCILHIGTEKTGTSSIQGFLAGNRRQLIRQGILYPEAAGLGGGSQWEFVACVQDAPWGTDIGRRLAIADAGDQQRFRDELATQLEAEISGAPAARTLLISSEHMHSRLPGIRQIAKLKSFLDMFAETFEIVLYLRRQDRVSVSTYLHRIRMGQEHPAIFPRGHNGERLYYYDYERLFESWAAVFGEANIKLRLFSADEWHGRDLITDFCEACGIDAAPLARTRPLNESVTLAAAQFIGELSRQLPRSENASDIATHDGMVALISELFRDNPKPAGRQDAEAFYALFEESNERLRRRALPDRQAPLFDADFSAYPEQVEPLGAPDYSEAVAIAVAIWRHTQQHSWTGLPSRIRSRFVTILRNCLQR